MSGDDRPSDEEIPPCPVCQSAAGEVLALHVAPSGDPYGDPEMEEMGRERSFVRCNNCGVLFDPRVRDRGQNARE